MAYDKQTWDTTSYVNPTRMNHIEDGIANAMTSGNMSYLGAKNLNAYPYYEGSHTDHNVVWTDNGDGTVVANGKATGANGDFNCHSHSATNELYQLILPNGKYIVSGCPTGGSTSTYYIQIGCYDTAGENFVVLGRDLGNGVEITLNGDYYSVNSVRLNITCRVYNNYTANNLVFKPMIRLAGDNDNTWQPYAMTNKQITDWTRNVKKNYTLILNKNNLSTSATSYDCNWKDYTELYITLGTYENLIAQMEIPSTYFDGTTSGNRVIIRYIDTSFYEIYKNGDDKVYIKGTNVNENDRIKFYGVKYGV